MSIRCFVAIELDEQIKKILPKLQAQLRRALRFEESRIKWVRPENIHLTLKFLGDVEDSLLPDVCEAVSEAARAFEPFDFELGNYGCFSSAGSASVLWVGIIDGNKKLSALVDALDENLGVLDFPSERRQFSAHLTLARIRNVKAGRAVRPVIEELPPFSLTFQQVTELTLFQSELTRAVTVYTALHHSPLAKHKK